ncbi:hypothetical protein ACJX0J_013782, partial [Zea mays]
MKALKVVGELEDINQQAMEDYAKLFGSPISAQISRLPGNIIWGAQALTELMITSSEEKVQQSLRKPSTFQALSQLPTRIFGLNTTSKKSGILYGYLHGLFSLASINFYWKNLPVNLCKRERHNFLILNGSI